MQKINFLAIGYFVCENNLNRTITFCDSLTKGKDKQ